MDGLTFDMAIVFAIILLSIALFVVEIVRVDVTAILVLVLLGITQILPPEQLFSGFSSDAVVSIIGVMIMVQGLERSGAMQGLSRWILKLGHDKEGRLQVLLIIIGGSLAGFMRSVGSVALLLPVVSRIAKRTGISKGQFLLPLGFASILGSTLTMVGTGPLVLLNNLLINADGLRDAEGRAHEPFGLFSVFPVGLALMVVGVLYFVAFRRWLLPPVDKRPVSHRTTLEYFRKTYQVGGALLEVHVLPESPWVGLTLRDIEDRLDPTLVVIGVKAGEVMHFPPLRKQEVRAGMVLAILGDKALLKKTAMENMLLLAPGLSMFAETLHPAQSGLAEAVIPPSSHWVGREMRELHMRREHSVQIVALHRGSRVLKGREMMDITIRPGDTLGLFCQWHILQQLESLPDLVILTPDYPREDPYTNRNYTAIALLVLTAWLVLFSIVPLSVALMVGAVGMVFTGVLSIDEAYTAVSWKTVFLLAGIIPLGIAMQVSGAALWVTSHLLPIVTSWSLWKIEIVMALIATLLGLVMSNVGATVLLVPIVVELAKQMGGDPRLFGMIVALATSNLFIIPTHQANALILGPGRYSVKDFLRAGAGLTVLYWLVMLWIVPWVVRIS